MRTSGENERRTTGRRSLAARTTLLLLLLILLAAASGCSNGEPLIVIVTPTNGSFEAGATVGVAGVLVNIDSAAIADVRVNGVSVLPLTGMTFSTTVTLDTVAIVNPIATVSRVTGMSPPS